ncbi:uncharacterized protein F5891DRAFT_1196546 [Suillus fuscotomentosus]|uniref:Uncharacterized protein n=1 Tax=Suillus fuscotomentosus TaxID=1912939 RepID=A0AAD4DSV5_9AGAM|nr:uncharacterized protein F5891DRAFT_1196546 [Suillus fuscotomentosus]KAG1893315.1 hypothetical protein F5891DRAFT_1196546 [Suillus fuscotomentosus]
MLRRPSHQTLQENLQAGRENQRRHYEKDRILSWRRELRVEKNTGPSELEKAIERALHGYDSDEDGDESETGNSSDIEENDDSLSDLTGCLLTLKGIKDEMLSLITEPRAFAEGALLQFVNSIVYTNDRADNGDRTIVTNMIVTVQGLLNHSIPIQDKILNFCGVSAEFHAANTVTRYLSTTLAYLEDIDFYIHVEGVSELCVAHWMGELMYQKGSHV